MEGTARPEESRRRGDASQAAAAPSLRRETEKGARDGEGRRIKMSLLPLKKRASNYCSPSSGGPRSDADADDDCCSHPDKKRRLDDDCTVSATVRSCDRDEHRVEMSPPLPVKKRALKDCGTISDGSCSNGEDDSSCVSRPKKTRVDDCIARAEKDDADESCGAPIPRRQQGSLCSAAAEGDDSVSDAVKRLRRKGKSIAVEETSSVTPDPDGPSTPPKEKDKKKLMHDGIRTGPRPNARFFLQHEQSVEFDVPVRAELTEQGATVPRFVLRKRLRKSDVCTNQNRLLISCKRMKMAECPITWCLSPGERRRVEDVDMGLSVPALDGAGRWHPVTLKFLDSNSGYRLIAGWKDFLLGNGLKLSKAGLWTRDVDVDLWAFRSRALPKQSPKPPPKLNELGEKEKDPKEKPWILVKGDDGRLIRQCKDDGIPMPEVDDHLHKDGALGFLLLHREYERSGGEEEEEDDDEAGPRRKSNKKRSTKKRKRDEPEASEDTDLQGEAATTMSREKIVAKAGENLADAVIGLMMLRDAVLELGCPQNVDVEGPETTTPRIA